MTHDDPDGVLVLRRRLRHHGADHPDPDDGRARHRPGVRGPVAPHQLRPAVHQGCHPRRDDGRRRGPADDGAAAADRATRNRCPRPVDDAVAEAGRRLRAIIDEHGPDAVALYVSGQMSIEAQYLATKLAKGFLRTVHIESNSRLCMASAGTGIQAVARRRRPARVLHRLRLRRPVFRHRLEHGRLPSDPVPADGGPAQGRRQADRRRSAPHHHRRAGRPVPADQTRHRPGAAQRAAAPARRKRRHRRRIHRRAHRGLGRHAGVPGRLSAATGSPRSPASPRPTSAPPPR